MIQVSRSRFSDLPREQVAEMVRDSFFASPGFAELWRHKGGRPVVWTAECDGTCAAILPGVEFGRGPLARFASMPDGCYGGVFTKSGRPEDRRRLCSSLLEGVARRRYVKAFIFDFYAAVPNHRRFRRRRHEAYVVDLAGSPWRPSDAKLMSQIRKAERAAVRVETLDWDRHGSRFMELMIRTEWRHGRPPRYPEAFFRDLAALAERDDRIHWLWCEHDQHAVCSHIYFQDRGTLQCWQSYLDKRYAALKANQYVRYQACRAAQSRGVARLNLGEVPDDADGLTRYKKRWGANPVPYPAYERILPLAKLI